MSYDNGTFARNLKVERARRGWNQRDLADAAGIGFNTVARYEMGVHTPGLDNALALARALGTSIDALVGWEPPAQPAAPAPIPGLPGGAPSAATSAG